MTDIFISYKREDHDRARQIADGLEAKRWTVWWDPKLQAGEHFDDAIEGVITHAKCVLVLWSSLSVHSRFVKDEATLALRLEKLLPIALDHATPPFRFANLHTVSLRGWDGNIEAPAFRLLTEQIMLQFVKSAKTFTPSKLEGLDLSSIFSSTSTGPEANEHQSSAAKNEPEPQTKIRNIAKEGKKK